ncbi:hypothetical protein I5H56_gp105 [Mycobacterium phage KristaRAM]|uniref:Uncharacterized protein n=1 Tax=Mycobacterium phage KristaRAM TaxID=2301700 RepID=A0A385DZW3_9CAUD|nr:hypothetical protein I5H56_gp105 [Mycobacterium phage KristaRAM]AXQ64162.1 hypothetical protein SEA_KRISTARAM_105 [Mycobacterium phage KristaRAM]
MTAPVDVRDEIGGEGCADRISGGLAGEYPK